MGNATRFGGGTAVSPRNRQKLRNPTPGNRYSQYEPGNEISAGNMTAADFSRFLAHNPLSPLASLMALPPYPYIMISTTSIPAIIKEITHDKTYS